MACDPHTCQAICPTGNNYFHTRLQMTSHDDVINWTQVYVESKTNSYNAVKGWKVSTMPGD